MNKFVLEMEVVVSINEQQIFYLHLCMYSLTLSEGPKISNYLESAKLINTDKNAIKGSHFKI